MNPNQQNTPIKNPLAAIQDGEVNIFQVHRHPIGIIGTYIVAGLLLIGLAVLIYAVLPSTLTSISTSRVYGIGTLGFILIALLVFGFLAITHTVYWGNSWILTSDSLTQVSQVSLFGKQSSQLSLGNLEDVSSNQGGIVAHMFNYGTLKVETAGEHSKFVFPFCPNPNLYAQQIINAREKFEQGRRESETPPAAQ